MVKSLNHKEDEGRMRDKIIFSLNRRRIALAMLGIVATIALDVYLPETMLKFTIAVSLLFAMGGLLCVKISCRASELIWVFAALAAAFASVVFVQLVNECPVLLPARRLLLGTIAAFIFILLLYNVFLLFARSSGAAKLAIVLGSLLLILLGVINFYTAYSRGKGISPIDFRAIGTALNVAGNFTFAVTARMWQALIFFIAAAFSLSGIKTESPVIDGDIWFRLVKLHVPTFALTILLMLSFWRVLDTVPVHHWENTGCENNGLILNLCAQLKQELNSKPENYSRDQISQLETEYISENQEQLKQAPNIIVIMNEAFADLRVWGDFDTNIPVMPNFDDMSENVIKGRALVSIIGGGTANSEYEFITGNSLFFHSPSSMPYQQYIYRDTYCLETYLSSFGYSSYFTHPGLNTNWSRHTVYPNLGFDTITFDDAYPDVKGKPVFAQDDYVYDTLIEQYESADQGQRQFMFAVTIQNHSPYGQGEIFDEPVSLSDCDMPEAEVYLSRIHKSDKAFAELLDYFESREEPVIILMYGDHHPKITTEFKDAIGAESGSDYAIDMKQYTVPFVIWANYDIAEKNVELTSLNFLSNYLLEAAGLPLSPYNKFLKDVQQVIPAMNGYGYWSNSRGGFASYDEAQGEEKQWLEAYEKLQYNSLFDKKGRSDVFFPIN